MARIINKDLEKLARTIDISHEMYDKAVSVYEYLTTLFVEKGVEANFYPQGSFSLGTVIKPFSASGTKEYDLDLVVEINEKKANIEPEEVKMIFKKIIDNCIETKKHLLPEDNRCWTLLYDKDNFKLDIVPSVHEEKSIILKIASMDIPMDYVEKSIAITDKKSSGNYSWGKSNPKGYAQWFNDINNPYMIATLENRKKEILNESMANFSESEIEEIPELLQRSALQRAIQILKHHRNLYFYNLSKHDKNLHDYKPASVIITTLCAKIAASFNQTIGATDDIYELISIITSELTEYADLLSHKDSCIFESTRISKEKEVFLTKKENKWSLKNPVNPEDDYTDSWTILHAEYFFKWINAVINDFDNINKTRTLNETAYFSAMESSFGSNTTIGAFPELEKIKATNIITNPTQPYGM